MAEVKIELAVDSKAGTAKIQSFSKEGSSAFDKLGSKGGSAFKKLESKGTSAFSKLKSKGSSAFKKLGSSIANLAKKMFNWKTAVAGLLGSAGIGALIKSTANAGDQFEKMSKKTGVSAQALSELKHAAEISGTSVETIGTGLKKLAKTMFDSNEGLAEAERTFSNLGISVTDTEGKLRNVDDVFMESVDALNRLESETAKAALAQELFGRSGVELLPLIKSGARGIAELREEARQLGITFNDVEAQQSAEFNDSLTRLKGAFTGLKNTIGKDVIPAITKLADRMTEFLKNNATKIIDGIKDAFDLLSGTVKVLWNLFTAVPRGLFTFFGNLRDEADKTKGKFDELKDKTEEALMPKTSFQKAWDWWKTFSADLWDVWTFTWESIGNTVAFAISLIIDNIKGFISWLQPMGELMLGAFTLDYGMIKKGLSGLSEVASELATDMGNSWRAYKTGVLTDLDDMVGKMQDRLGGVPAEVAIDTKVRMKIEPPEPSVIDDAVKGVAQAVTDAFKDLSVESESALVSMAQSALNNFQKIKQSGTATPWDIARAYEKASGAIEGVLDQMRGKQEETADTTTDRWNRLFAAMAQKGPGALYKFQQSLYDTSEKSNVTAESVGNVEAMLEKLGGVNSEPEIIIKDVDGVYRNIKAVQSGFKDIDDITAKPGIEIQEDASIKIDDIKSALEKVGNINAQPKINIDTSLALATIDRFKNNVSDIKAGITLSVSTKQAYIDIKNLLNNIPTDITTTLHFKGEGSRTLPISEKITEIKGNIGSIADVQPIITADFSSITGEIEMAKEILKSLKLEKLAMPGDADHSGIDGRIKAAKTRVEMVRREQPRITDSSSLTEGFKESLSGMSDYMQLARERWSIESMNRMPGGLAGGYFPWMQNTPRDNYLNALNDEMRRLRQKETPPPPAKPPVHVVRKSVSRGIATRDTDPGSTTNLGGVTINIENPSSDPKIFARQVFKELRVLMSRL